MGCMRGNLHFVVLVLTRATLRPFIQLKRRLGMIQGLNEKLTCVLTEKRGYLDKQSVARGTLDVLHSMVRLQHVTCLVIQRLGLLYVYTDHS